MDPSLHFTLGQPRTSKSLTKNTSLDEPRGWVVLRSKIRMREWISADTMWVCPCIRKGSAYARAI